MELQEIQPQVLPQGLHYPAALFSVEGHAVEHLIDQPLRKAPLPAPVLDREKPLGKKRLLDLYTNRPVHATKSLVPSAGKVRLNISKCQEEKRLKLGLGERLRLLRKALGLSQAEFASKLGVKQRAISHWEREETEPSFKTLQRISEIWSVNPIWLFKGEGPMFLHEAEPEKSLPPELASALQNPRIQKIVLMLKQLPEEDLEEIYRDLQKTKRQREERDRLLKEIEELKKLLKAG